MAQPNVQKIRIKLMAYDHRLLDVSTEEIVDNEVIRREPWRTVIPFFVVDAVVEAPYGAHPCQMPGRYYYDEENIAEWLLAAPAARRNQP